MHFERGDTSSGPDVKINETSLTDLPHRSLMSHAIRSRLIFGLWPLAGITTVGVTDSDADQTMSAAIESGITMFDTAFSYGYEGQSDRLLGRFVSGDRDRFTVVGKVGQRWTADRTRVIDGSPETLTADAETSLRRIGIEQFDRLMLHCPDPNVPIERSAEAIDALRRRGLCRSVGVCNVNESELRRFAAVAQAGEFSGSAIQCPLNLLQPASLSTIVPLAANLGFEVDVYWTLMKGLLAGQISRDHVFAEGDSRPNYAVFQGAARHRAHDLLDAMKPIASSIGKTIAQLSIGWAISQAGVTAALVGARKPDQVREIAAAEPLPKDVLEQLDRLRGIES